MRIGFLSIVALAFGCAHSERQAQPNPISGQSLAGVWSDGSVVFQFNDDQSCVLMGPRFNVRGKYALADTNLTITNAKQQYSAHGFLKFDETTIHLQATLKEKLEVLDTSARFVETRTTLRRLNPEEAREAIGRISKAHREAVRAAAKPPRPDKPR